MKKGLNSENLAKGQIEQVLCNQNFQCNQLSLYVQSAYKVDQHCLSGVMALFNGRWMFGTQLSQKMKLKKMRSNCKKKSDEIFVDCGSNDDAVYAQARQIKQ